MQNTMLRVPPYKLERAGSLVEIQNDGDILLTPVAGRSITLGGAVTLSGAIDMGNNVITNIGAAGTDFSGTGGLTLADQLTVAGGIVSAPGYSFVGATDTGFYIDVNGINAAVSGTRYSALTSTGFSILSSTGQLTLSSSADVILLREAAGTLVLRNAANAQTFRAYSTFTNATNYERASLSTTIGSGITLAAETAGTGADNLGITLTPAGAGAVLVNSPGGTIANIASSTYKALSVPAHTITLSAVTQVTSTTFASALTLDVITIAQSGGAVTVDSAATLDIIGPPAAGASVTLTTPLALKVRAGNSSFAGRVSVGGTGETNVLLHGLGLTTAGDSDVWGFHISGTLALGSPYSTSLYGFGANATYGSSNHTYTGQANGLATFNMTKGTSSTIARVVGIATILPTIGLGNTGIYIGTMGAAPNTGSYAIYDNTAAAIRFGTGGVTVAGGGIEVIGNASSISGVAVASGSTLLTLTPGAHTAVVAEKLALSIATATITLADTTTIAEYAWAKIEAPTFAGVAAGGAEVITDAATLLLTGDPINGGNITLTRSYAFWNKGKTRYGDNVHLDATKVFQAQSGVIGLGVVSTALTLGSAGSIIAPFADMGNAANDAARDALAGNVDGCTAIDSVGVGGVFKIWARVGGAWKSAVIA